MDRGVTCINCGHAATDPEARFCAACGSRLAAPLTPRAYTPGDLAERIVAGTRESFGECKQVSILFADVKGSMEHAASLGPERWHRVMDGFFKILCRGIHRYEGTVSKFTGDGAMAFFGAPLAHEDHARRACLAALELQAELAERSAELREQEIEFGVRIGINSGSVVLGSLGEDLAVDYTSVGEAVGLAQRMEQLAEPGTVYLTERTRDLVEGYFELTSRGSAQVKGVEAEIEVFELERAGEARTPLDLSRARGLSRLVGRSREQAILVEALERAQAGDGQVIGIRGEPGVGKSRLALELERSCGPDTLVHRAYGQSHTAHIPFAPVLEMFRSFFERDPGAAARLEATISEQDREVLLDFVGTRAPGLRALEMDPDARRRRLLGIVRRLVQAEGRPTVLIVEDLHWIDIASAPFLEALVEATEASRTLLVLTFRPEYQPAFEGAGHYRELQLQPLDQPAAAELIAELLGEDSSLDGLVELIAERTRGNAFFIEEVVRDLAGSGALAGERGAYRLGRSIDAVSVPTTVDAVLAARIDRLPGNDREVLKLAAVVGKRFDPAVLRRIAAVDEAQLLRSLESLAEAGFLSGDRDHGGALTFMHPLTQEVAYESQLSDSRRQIHADVAEALRELRADSLDENAALISAHEEEAGNLLAAAQWGRRAAQHAGVNDPEEAARNWRRVVALSDGVPGSRQARSLGVEARIWILQMGWRQGIRVEEASAISARGRELAREAADYASESMLVTALARVMGMNGKVDEAIEMAKEAGSVADRSGERSAQLAARADTFWALWLRGRLPEGLEVLDEGLTLIDGDAELSAGLDLPTALGVFTFFRGNFVSFMGDLRAGRGTSAEGLRILQEQGAAEQTIWADAHLEHHGSGLVGTVDPEIKHAKRAVETAERLGSAWSLAFSYAFLGHGHLRNGRFAEAEAACEHARSIAIERQAALEFLPYTLSFLAEAKAELGHDEDAIEYAGQAVGFVDGLGLRLLDAPPRLALSRVLRKCRGSAAAEEIDRTLRRGVEVSKQTGNRAERPLLHVELAELARLREDDAGWERELRVARELFRDNGAEGHLARVEAELERQAPGVEG